MLPQISSGTPPLALRFSGRYRSAYRYPEEWQSSQRSGFAARRKEGRFTPNTQCETWSCERLVDMDLRALETCFVICRRFAHDIGRERVGALPLVRSALGSIGSCNNHHIARAFLPWVRGWHPATAPNHQAHPTKVGIHYSAA